MALASALLPFRGMKYTVKKKQLLVVESAIREGLKVPIVRFVDDF